MKRVLLAMLATLAMLAAMGLPASAGGDRADVNWWDGTPVGKGSHTNLDRDAPSVHAHLRGLPAGHAITIWAVVFELPENCDDGCGEDDVVAAFMGDTDVDLTVTFAAGGVTNGGGNLNVQNTIGGGDTLIGDGTIDNNETAEIHFVVRSHGPDQEGDADTTTFNGGCDGPDLPAGTVPMNVGECADVQFSLHFP